MEERRYELDLAPRRSLFRLKIFRKKDEEWYNKKCDELQEGLRSALGEEARINSHSYMFDSVIFKITVPFDKEDFAMGIIMDLVEKHFPS